MDKLTLKSLICLIVFVILLVLANVLPNPYLKHSPSPEKRENSSTVVPASRIIHVSDVPSVTRADPIANAYIGNKSSKKFHLPSCSYLPDQNNQVTFDSREEAIAAGYDPCGHCHP